ncbi:MAG: UvrD-helicase domain-containing protein, partial [Clostridia bacterium]|nr:UvrD-helicase domain-containing protein [Clostridia bacterium]
ILNTVRLFEENPEILDRYVRKFRYLCVDEYQDTNAAQFRLCELFSSVHKNIMVVGDDDQSIYAFRGATVENILHFDDAFPDARVVKLEQNYRSTQNILDAANAVIAHNSARHEKSLWTEEREGERVEVVRVPDQNAEARYLCELIQRRRREGGRYADNAILYRVNAQSGGVETALTKSGIPYRVLAGTRFFDRKEVKDILAYLCLIENHGDDLRLRRIVNEPKRKIGDAALDAAERIAAEEGISLFDVMKTVERYPYLSAFAQRFSLFVRMIEELTEFSRAASVSELTERVITATGYKKMLTDEGEEARDRLENLEELISGCVEYEQRAEEPSLSGYLEEISLLSDVDKYDENADAVILMTIHSAKGLEFPNVYLPGMEEGLFPGAKVTADPSELPEERRLAYVAITRAKKRLTMVYAKERLLYGRTSYNPPSRFLSELPEEKVKKLDLCPAVSSRAAFVGASRFRQPEKRQTAGLPSFSTPARPAGGKAPSFSAGDRVRHLVFGTGTVAARTEMGGDVLYDVEFDTAGRKRLMGSYAKLTPAD